MTERPYYPVRNLVWAGRRFRIEHPAKLSCWYITDVDDNDTQVARVVRTTSGSPPDLGLQVDDLRDGVLALQAAAIFVASEPPQERDPTKVVFRDEVQLGQRTLDVSMFGDGKIIVVATTSTPGIGPLDPEPALGPGDLTDQVKRLINTPGMKLPT